METDKKASTTSKNTKTKVCRDEKSEVTWPEQTILLKEINQKVLAKEGKIKKT